MTEPQIVAALAEIENQCAAWAKSATAMNLNRYVRYSLEDKIAAATWAANLVRAALGADQ